jgi:hypothetical protein
MIFSLLRFLIIGPLIPPVALLATGGAVGYWFGIGSTGTVDRILAATVLAIAAIAAIIWRYRHDARQRWQSVLNRYAEREIALATNRQPTRRLRRSV